MEPEGIGEEFMRLTRYTSAVPSDQKRGMPPPPLHHRHPLAGESIPLPAPSACPVDLHALITARKTVREYAETSLSLPELSWLLWATQGVKGIRGNNLCTSRTVPSAGARHPFETYLAVQRVDSIQPGLYQYSSPDHGIAPVAVGDDIAQRLCEACLDQSMLLDSAVSFIWTAIPYRTTWRYGQRGYRYMHLDAGHVCQNLYLAAESIGAGCCAIAAFDDEAMTKAIQIDPAESFVIYLATVGKTLG